MGPLCYRLLHGPGYVVVVEIPAGEALRLVWLATIPLSLEVQPSIIILDPPCTSIKGLIVSIVWGISKGVGGAGAMTLLKEPRSG